MRCPKCQHNKSNVIDSRQAEDGNTIRRRRECDACHARFTTFERVEEVPLLVVKKDGTREQFSRDKDIENAITRIEKNIRRNHDGEVDSEVIGNLVMKELADLDEITYVRFASVYRSFKDVDEIEELLQEITKTVRAKKESKK